MRTIDILKLILIIILLGAIILSSFASIGVNKVKKNWPVYRCNPMVMPFASKFGHDSTQNFMYCMKNMQSSFMSVMLKPIHYTMTLANHLGGSIETDINNVRKMFSQIRNMITSIISTVFGVFLNILIQFQHIFIKLKDMLMKVTGILTTVFFLIDSFVKTGESIYNGPIVGTLNTVADIF